MLKSKAWLQTDSTVKDPHSAVTDITAPFFFQVLRSVVISVIILAVSAKQKKKNVKNKNSEQRRTKDLKKSEVKTFDRKHV